MTTNNNQKPQKTARKRAFSGQNHYGVQEAGSSNLLTQTTFEETDTFVSVFLLCRVRRPLELRDAAALPCYSVALLLTNLLTQTTSKSDEHWVTGSSDYYFYHPKITFDTNSDTNII
ncbi:MAG: hypothetical protein ACI4M2_03310 [Christensenellales bacterium]